MFVQSSICQASVKNNSRKFFTISKLLANFDFFVSITLRIEVAIKLSQSPIIVTCLDYVVHKHSSKIVKVVSGP